MYFFSYNIYYIVDIDVLHILFIICVNFKLNFPKGEQTKEVEIQIHTL